MAYQDGLLSFQIKETVFLSSDKAGIGALKELELLPDVEIIENPQEVSITGCLHLQGKYDPYQEPAEDVKEAADDANSNTLVAALKFTPFQLEENNSGPFAVAQEQILSHRVPLNISIPVNRIEEITEIYAIVDSFDYQLISPNELQIDAQLKIAGIELQKAAEEKAEQQAEETWEFVHVANPEQSQIQPVSLEEIERKLARLEEEIYEREAAERAGAAPVYYTPDAGDFRSEESYESSVYDAGDSADAAETATSYPLAS